MGETSLHFQEPTATSPTLADAIVLAARGAECGGGIFAFATVRGIDDLLKDRALRDLARERSFKLVVGVDSITNVAALELLAAYQARYAQLEARVLLHGIASLFHPKLCWFREGDALTLLVGSGNLTPGGLTDNFEAFVTVRARGREATALEGQIESWFERWDEKLLAPEDPEALARAAENTGSERSLLKSMEAAPEFPERPTPPSIESPVLVAEMSSNRPAQFDVGVEMLEGFFGAIPEVTHLRLQHVNETGSLEQPEPPRRSFRNSSRNYRFETTAAARRELPAEGEPRRLAVFVRMPDGIFRYRVLWGEDHGYAEIDALLREQVGDPPPPKGGRARRLPTTVAELAAAWPDSPLLAAVGGTP